MPRMPVTTPRRPVPKSNFLDPRSFHHLLGDIQHGKIGALAISLLYFRLLYFLRGAENELSLPR